MSYGISIKNSSGVVRFDGNSEMMRLYSEGTVRFNAVQVQTHTVYFTALPYAPQVHIELNQLVPGSLVVTPYTDRVSISIDSRPYVTNGLIVTYSVLRV